MNSVDTSSSQWVKTSRQGRLDVVFYGVMTAAAIFVMMLIAAIFAELIINAMPALQKQGVKFFWTEAWNPVTKEFGALSSIYGTLVSTAIALVLAVPLSVGVALFLVELAPPSIGRIIGSAIELLAAIPSIIYGMWGLFVFAPFMADYVQPFLATTFGFVPFFQGPPMGIGMLTSGIILALMILPFVSSVMRDVFSMVPAVVKESAYGLGCTTWEVARKVTLPYGMKGVIGACFLGLGRALGETMAVTFVIGNNHNISTSLFETGSSIASTLANEFGEASDPDYLSALMALALALGMITVFIQIISQIWLKRAFKKSGRGL